MARTLVIGNADFSVNKLDTVILNGVPCTGISLNEDAVSITSIASTQTVVATVTPADTTDAIIWSSSDTDVATVAGGVITAVGCGSATITATCGQYSDSCSVTVTHTAVLSVIKNSYAAKDSNKDYLTGGDLDKYAVGCSASGTYKLLNGNKQWYGVPIPKGAENIVITATGAYQTYGFWVSVTEHCQAADTVALAYAKGNFGTAVNYSEPRTVEIPDRSSGTYEGMDGVTFIFRYNATVTDENVGNISVVFTA